MRREQGWREIVLSVLCVLVLAMGLQLVDLQRAIEAQREVQVVQSRLMRQIGQALVGSPELLLEPLPAQE
jgi:hypothetical protein